MGMFDTTVCEAPTPDGKIGSTGQTKEFGCMMVTIRISADGDLSEETGYFEDDPTQEVTPNLQWWPGTPQRWVHTGWTPIKLFTGKVNVGFYDAVFLRGMLMGFESEDDPSQFFPFEEPS